MIERDPAYRAGPVRDVMIELFGQLKPSISGAGRLFLLSMVGGMDVRMPMALYLFGARGLPGYFLLVVVAVVVPIITVSDTASDSASEMLTCCLR